MAAYFDLGAMDFSGLANIDWAALGYPQFAQQAPAPSPTGMLSSATQAPAPASSLRYYDAEGTEITNPDQILQMQQAPAPSPTGMLSGATQAPATFDLTGLDLSGLAVMSLSDFGLGMGTGTLQADWSQGGQTPVTQAEIDAVTPEQMRAYAKQNGGTPTRAQVAYDIKYGYMPNSGAMTLQDVAQTFGPVVAGVYAPYLSAALGGGTVGGMGAGALLGGGVSGLSGGNILTGALTGGAVAGLGGMASDYFSAPTDTVNPLNQIYRDELLSGMYDGAAPAQTLSDSSGNLFNLSNSGANPYSPMLGGGGGETFPTNLAPTFGSPTPIDPLYSGNYVDPSLTAPWTNNTSAGLPGQMLTGAAPLGTFTLPEPITYGPTPGAPVFPNGVDSIANAASSPTGYVDPYSSGSITGTSVAEGAMTPASLGALGAGATGLGLASAGAAATGGAGLTGIAAALAAAGLSPEIAQSIATGLGSSGLLSGALALGGGYLQGQAAQDAANTSANAQIEAAKIAADAAKFRPVGITTNFGSSNFTKDAQGNVTGAGYTLSPEMLAQQAKLMGVSEQALQQYLGAQGATAPMGDAAQRMMTLGNSYLATTPQEQAAKYMAEQQALLATGRERYVNNMLTGEYNRGTYGLSVGGTSTGMNAANPRLEAMFNAQRQQDLGLAAQATQGGMDYAKFGGAMTGLGGDMLNSMYGTQSAAFSPYNTALGGARTIEGLGQNSLDLGINIGKVSNNAQAGMLLGQGMANAATTVQNGAQSPWGDMLGTASKMLSNYQTQQANPSYDPTKFRLVPFGQ